MGMLIDYDHVSAALQVTSKKFGTMEKFVDHTMLCMLGNIPPVDAIRIPENATNGDMIKAMFPNMHMDNELNGIWYGYTSNDPQPREAPMLGVNLEWWNAPYRRTEVSK